MTRPAWINTNLAPLAATFVVMMLMFAFGAIEYDGFTKPRNIQALFQDNAYIAIAAVGATFVIISGGIDLSVGAMIAFTTTLIASLIQNHDMNPMLAISIALACGAASGAIMGWLIAFFELPPFMVTLAGMFFFRAMGFVIQESALQIDNELIQTLSELGYRIVSWKMKISMLTMFMIGVFAIGMVILHLTSFGRNVYAVGGNENSAKLMGLPVFRTKITIYTIAGFCSALAGVVATLYKGNGDPAGFVGYELDAIAAVVIGGTLLTGGSGYLFGTLLGVLILGLIQSIINFQGDLNAAWTRIVVGLLVLGFILFQRLLNRLTT